MGLINDPRGVWGAIRERLLSKVLGDGVVRTKAFPSSSTGGQPYSPQTKAGAVTYNGGAVTLSVSVSLSTLADPVVVYLPGAVTLAAAVALTPGTPTVIPPASVTPEYQRLFHSYRPASRRTYRGGSST